MASVFTKIIRGEIPGHRVYEDEAHYAFLDIHPIQPGHTLLVPKREVDYLFDLQPEELAALFRAAQTVAQALKRVTACARVVVTVVGYEVPHAHVHLIPTNRLGDYPPPPTGTLEPAWAEDFAARVRDALPS
jgi:histidine triad (HIT) family protein